MMTPAINLTKILCILEAVNNCGLMRLLLMDGEEHCGALNEWPQMAWIIKVAGPVVRKLTQAKSQNNE